MSTKPHPFVSFSHTKRLAEVCLQQAETGPLLFDRLIRRVVLVEKRVLYDQMEMVPRA